MGVAPNSIPNPNLAHYFVLVVFRFSETKSATFSRSLIHCFLKLAILHEKLSVQ